MLTEETKRLCWLTFPSAQDLRWSLRKVYLQCDHATRLLTHIRQPFTSYVIDLTLSEDELFSNYSKKLRRNIRRAIREEISVERDQNPAAVVELFQPTILEKGLNPLREIDFDRKNNLLITRAVHPELRTLAAHAYLLDKKLKKVKSEYNASAFRQYWEDKPTQYLCGRANSLLYHLDLLYFREQGYELFDFGGYGGLAPGADYFKDRLGGTVVTQYNYYPIWYYFVRCLRNHWKKPPDARQ